MSSSEQNKMDDLYPGYREGVGFLVDGFACTLPKGSPRAGQVAVDIPSYFKYLIVANLDPYERPIPSNPRFNFKVLTTEFLSNCIDNNQTFEFSVAQRQLGKVVYVSGAAARDYFGDIEQEVRSIQTQGELSREGLRLMMQGDLGDMSARLDKTAMAKFKQASYKIEVLIPWSVLRFMFWDKIHFVLSNYRRL